MLQKKCPLCNSENFYVKDPEDAYEVFEFSVQEGNVVFSEEEDATEAPDVAEETETFCTRCAWHDKFRKL